MRPKTSSSSGSPDSGISGSGSNASRRRSRRHSRRRRHTSSLCDVPDRIIDDENRLSDDQLSDEDGNIDDDDSSSSCCSSDHEEEFYYTEVERCDAGRPAPPSPPTLSHRDMARPPHEDPEYQKKIVGNMRQGLLMCKPINIPSNLQHPTPALHIMNSTPPQKHVRLSPRPSTSYAPYPILQSSNTNTNIIVNAFPSHQGAVTALSHSAPSRYSHGAPLSPSRRTRGENKKCRKVYGMEHRDQWCTQCKWKKACSRFGD
ncbi:zinc finger protein 395-like [Ctenocephalides felis]|uniref:zinc finger protein 395-like n=1 Tax=Ctenocephalides felis TaxID=7515 RepID=UPI000E6E1809|nr:zinc finger protein 395-like [Ctenocephalides felis]